jgi:hypothetical protein
MGYTQYWYRKPEPPTDDAWNKFTNFFFAAERECRNRGVRVDAQLDSQAIVFNGVPGCEPFAFQRNPRAGMTPRRLALPDTDEFKWFHFCKTTGQPYDLLVVACLEAARRLDLIRQWDSDGMGHQVKPGIDLCNKFLPPV